MSKSSQNRSQILSLDASASRNESFIFPDISGDVSRYTNLLLIDQSVKDYQDFITSANTQTFTVAYSSKSSREELLSLLKKNFTSFQRIGIVFTSIGSLANPFLNSEPFFRKKESAPYSDNVRFIVNLIKDFGVKNIDYLGCNTLQYPNWVNYYSILTAQTGVVVGASNDETGNIKYGGDWVMESTGTDVELVYFTKGIEYHKNLLDLGYCSFVIKDGKLYGTGDNGNNQLGIGINTLQLMINQTGKTVKSVACGYSHTIVLMTDGTVYGTGENWGGQLGTGNYTSTNILTLITTVPVDKTPNAISCGDNHTIVLMDDGSIYGTGVNYNGQLGNGNTNSQNTLTQMISMPSGKIPVAISCGRDHTIVLMTDDSVYGTGANGNGQLGIGNIDDKNTLTQMTSVPEGKTPDAISCGVSHTIVLMIDGTVFGTGYNQFGQLGDGTYYNSTSTLTQMMIDDVSTPVTDAKAISCGGYYTIVLRMNGTVYGTGENTYGQLGNGNTNSQSILMPMDMPVGKTSDAISCQRDHTIVLMTDETVYGTGDNRDGQLGNGNINQQTTLTQMKIGYGNTYVTDAKDIICGGYYTIVLRINGTVYGTGNNRYGQLGNGSTNFSQTTLTLIPSIPEEKTPLAISCGKWHTIVLMSDGSVYGTGDNNNGQLGTGDDNDTNTFTPMRISIGDGESELVTNVKTISCGYEHSIVLMNDGSVYGSGRNGNGQLGTGDDSDKNVLMPMRIKIGDGVSEPVTGVKAISCGEYHTIVLMNNGSVYGTGSNYDGQLGNVDVSENTNLLIPMTIGEGNIPVTNVKAIACGKYHTIVLMNNGTLYGTGDNGYGQLGTGDENDQTTLTPMINETGKTPVAISCGRDHIIVLMSDGTVYGIGRNNFGQLGDDSDNDTNTLTPMIMPGIPGLKAIAITTGRYHSVVLMNDRSVYGTGDNEDGQLGTGDENDQYILTPMTIGNGSTPVTNVSRLFDNDYFFVFTEEASCLLEGTLVLTNKGYLPIETLKPGDTIRTKNYYINIVKVGKWSVDLSREEDRNDLSKKMYKIPAGKYGAKKDTFISHYHRILYYMDEDNKERGYDIPINLGLKPAEPEEFTKDNGKYNLYHLQLVIGNHFIVNGECMVEAWNPDSKYF